MSRFKGQVNYLLSQMRGFKTNRKIVVIESDDWGTIRIPNQKTKEKLQKMGLDMVSNPYNQLDTLENVNDLDALYELLNNKNFSNNQPKITFNFITANPDFDKIESSEFKDYFYEKFTETYYHRDGNNDVKKMIDQGIDQHFIQPQFHGREHIHVLRWLHELQQQNEHFMHALKEKCFCVENTSNTNNRKNLLSAFEFETPLEKKFITQSITEGLAIFKSSFGFQSTSAVAPRHVWNDDIEEVLAKNNVQCIQSALNQLVPSKNNYQSVYHYTGETNQFNQIYTVRNAYFEPAYGSNINWEKQVLGKAKTAFLLKTPLIISMHRINFVGGINELNRLNNLTQFKSFLLKLISLYPDIEFLSTDELAKTILNKNVRN